MCFVLNIILVNKLREFDFLYFFLFKNYVCNNILNELYRMLDFVFLFNINV